MGKTSAAFPVLRQWVARAHDDGRPSAAAAAGTLPRARPGAHPTTGTGTAAPAAAGVTRELAAMGVRQLAGW